MFYLHLIKNSCLQKRQKSFYVDQAFYEIL